MERLTTEVVHSAAAQALHNPKVFRAEQVEGQGRLHILSQGISVDRGRPA
jgi:hypothetical protein